MAYSKRPFPYDLPPSNPLDHSLYLYADPHNIRTQLPQDTLNLIHVVPQTALATFERYYPNYAADPTHFLSLEGQSISRHGRRTDLTAYASIPELFHWLPDNEEEFHVAFATSPYAFIMSLTPLVSLITVSRHGSIL